MEVGLYNVQEPVNGNDCQYVNGSHHQVHEDKAVNLAKDASDSIRLAEEPFACGRRDYVERHVEHGHQQVDQRQAEEQEGRVLCQASPALEKCVRNDEEVS